MIERSYAIDESRVPVGWVTKSPVWLCPFRSHSYPLVLAVYITPRMADEVLSIFPPPACPLDAERHAVQRQIRLVRTEEVSP